VLLHYAIVTHLHRGFCVLGLGLATWPVLDRLMPKANAVGVGSVAPAVAAAALAQDPPVPTTVWYGVSQGDGNSSILYRIWSDGKVEALAVERVFINCNPETTTIRPCGA
jgi:hypothetical protein